MITIDMLNQNAALSALTDAQKAAIAELSKNDEATVIGTKIGALHGQYDADILGISGIAKNTGEKSYDYAKRVLNDYKTKLDGTKTLSAQLEAQKKKVTELETKLAAGGSDEALKQQLKDAKHQVVQLQTQLTAKGEELDNAKKNMKLKRKTCKSGLHSQMQQQVLSLRLASLNLFRRFCCQQQKMKFSQKALLILLMMAMAIRNSFLEMRMAILSITLRIISTHTRLMSLLWRLALRM